MADDLWVVKVKINIFFMLKSHGFNLNFETLVGYSTFFLKLLVEVHSFKGTEHMFLSSEYRIHGFEGTGYLVSKVRDT